jgi:5-methyltetrahydrofolate--homocysteine methyltransferase
MNPLHEPEMHAIMGADVMLGHDALCAKWLTKFREPAAEGAGGSRAERGERRRRRSAEAPAADAAPSEILPS